MKGWCHANGLTIDLAFLTTWEDRPFPWFPVEIWAVCFRVLQRMVDHRRGNHHSSEMNFVHPQYRLAPQPNNNFPDQWRPQFQLFFGGSAFRAEVRWGLRKRFCFILAVPLDQAMPKPEHFPHCRPGAEHSLNIPRNMGLVCRPFSNGEGFRVANSMLKKRVHLQQVLHQLTWPLAYGWVLAF